MRNGKKSPKILLLRNGDENGKAIQTPHADPDQHQNLNASIGSELAHFFLYHIWSTSVTLTASYDRYNDRTNDKMTEFTYNNLLTDRSHYSANLGGITRAFMSCTTPLKGLDYHYYT